MNCPKQNIKHEQNHHHAYSMP